MLGGKVGGGSAGCSSDWWSGGCGFDPSPVGNILSWRSITKYFIGSFSLLLIQERQLSVSGEKMCTVLVTWPKNLSLSEKKNKTWSYPELGWKPYIGDPVWLKWRWKGDLLLLVGCVSDWWSGGCGFDPRWVSNIPSWKFDHGIFSAVILSLPLIQEGQLSVSDERMCTVLFNCLED